MSRSAVVGRAAEPISGSDRDRFVDLVRGASILCVVVGHWLVTQLTWNGHELVLSSALGTAPWLWPLTWLLQVIPLFFFVGGLANLHSWNGVRRRREGYAAFVGRRLRRLSAPVGILLTALVVPSALFGLFGGVGRAGLGDGAGVLLQPLWFLGVYVVVVALTPWTVALHERWGGWVVVVLLGVVVLDDVLRFRLGVGAAGLLNVLLVWIAAHQLGYLYAGGRLTRVRAASMALGGFAVLGAVVALGWYPARMVGVPGDEVANMNPPTVALAALAVGQIGATVLLRPVVAPWLERPRVFASVVAVNLSIMTVYLWHQPAFVAVNRLLLPLGVPQPDPPGWSWWLTRPLWLGAAGGALALATVMLRRFERVAPRPPAPRGTVTATAAVASVLAYFAGFLALAATDITHLVAPVPVLGPVEVAPLAGLLCVAVAGVLQRATWAGGTTVVETEAAAAAVLALVGGGYVAGVSPLPQSTSAAFVLAGLACVLAALALVAAATGAGRGLLPHRGRV